MSNVNPGDGDPRILEAGHKVAASADATRVLLYPPFSVEFYEVGKPEPSATRKFQSLPQRDEDFKFVIEGKEYREESRYIDLTRGVVAIRLALIYGT